MQGGPSPGSSTARTSSQPQPGSSSTDVPAHTGTSNPLFGSSPSNEKTQQTATPPPPVSSPALQAAALEAPQPGEASRGPGAEGAWTRGLWAMDPYVSVLRMAVAYGLMVYGLGSILYQARAFFAYSAVGAAGAVLGAMMQARVGGRARLGEGRRRREEAGRGGHRWLSLLAGARGQEGPEARLWVRDVLGKVPNWVTSPDYEKASCLNAVLVKMWPHLSLCITQRIQTSVDAFLVAQQPSSMTSLMLREMSLGDSPPVLTGMKFLNTPAANEVLLECGVAWAAGKNAFAALQARTSLGEAVVHLRNLKVHGTLRVTLKPLLAKPPLVGKLAFSFIGDPDINFDTSHELTMTGMNLSMPMLSEWISTTVRQMIVSRTVIPNSVDIPLDHVWVEPSPGAGGEQLTYDLQALEARLQQDHGIRRMPTDQAAKLLQKNEMSGLLKISLMRAKLVTREHSPSPSTCVEFRLGDGAETVRSAVATSFVPEWNADFNFIVKPEDKILTLEFMDVKFEGIDYTNWWNPIHWGGAMAMALEEEEGGGARVASLTLRFQDLPEEQHVSQWHELRADDGKLSGAKVLLAMEWRPSSIFSTAHQGKTPRDPAPDQEQDRHVRVSTAPDPSTSLKKTGKVSSFNRTYRGDIGASVAKPKVELPGESPAMEPDDETLQMDESECESSSLSETRRDLAARASFAQANSRDFAAPAVAASAPKPMKAIGVVQLKVVYADGLQSSNSFSNSTPGDINPYLRIKVTDRDGMVEMLSTIKRATYRPSWPEEQFRFFLADCSEESMMEVHVLNALTAETRTETDPSLGVVGLDIRDIITSQGGYHGSLQEIVPLSNTKEGWVRIDFKWAKHFVQAGENTPRTRTSTDDSLRNHSD